MIGITSQLHSDHFRSSMHDPLRPLITLSSEQGSTSAVEPDLPIPSTSRFPISSIRPEAPQNCSARLPLGPPQLVYPRYDPLYILSCPPPPKPSPRPAYVHAYSPPAPSVAPGVLADGVLTAMLPAVKEFLSAATTAPPACPPLPSDKRVLALAALSVFYRPLHPAHWVFWNKEQKKITATIVQSVLDTTPTPIISPIGWIAIPENLWILSSMQHAYAPRLAGLPWYATYVHSEPENRMNLRKRKPAAIIRASAGGGTASADETGDEDEAATPPPRKRAKTRRAAAVSNATKEPAGAAMRTSAKNTPSAPESVISVPVVDVGTDPALAGEAGSDGQTTVGSEPTQLGSSLLLAPADQSSLPLPALTAEAKLEIIEGAVSDDHVPSILADSKAEDVFETRKSSRQRHRARRTTRASASTFTATSRAKARTTASTSPVSLASTLTPPTGARALSTLSSRQSPSSSADSATGSASGSSTAVSLYEGEEKDANKVAITVAEEAIAGNTQECREEDHEEPLVRKGRRTKSTANSRGSRASPKIAKEKREEITTSTQEAGKNTMAVDARPKPRARPKTRRR